MLPRKIEKVLKELEDDRGKEIQNEGIQWKAEFVL